MAATDNTEAVLNGPIYPPAVPEFELDGMNAPDTRIRIPFCRPSAS
jgi:hypothetical protein